MLKTLLLTLTLIAGPSSFQTLQAASPAFDSASDSAYNDGWQSGDNGGSGWGGGWQLATAGGTYTVGDSASNGNGETSAPVGDINSSGRALGLTATVNLAHAVRSFDGNLSIGQIFSFDFDVGVVQSGGAVGFDLQDSFNDSVFGFFVLAGSSNFSVVDSSGIRDSGISASDEGFHAEFRLTGASTYALDVTPLEGALSTITGSISSSGVNKFAPFSNGGGAGSANTLYVNNMRVIPEPTGVTLLASTACLAFIRRRRK